MSKPQTSPTPGRALPNPKGSPGNINGQPKFAPSAAPKKGSAPMQANNNSSSNTIVTIQKHIRRSLAMGNLVKLQTLERLRKQVIQELLDTERSYFKYLEQAISYYMIPIRESSMIKNAQIIALFKSFEEIQRVNKLILVALEKRMAQWKGLPKNQQRLGDIFTQLSPFLKVYSEYVTNYQTHITTINEKLNDPKMVVFLKKCASSIDAKYDQGQTIQSLLIMPIQRIPRYELLLREVLKFTNVEYSDYTELNKALVQIQQVANHINGIVKERQNLEKILTIQKNLRVPTGTNIPAGLVELGRQFVHEGKLVKVCRKDNQERYFFLFTDALLYTKDQGDGKYEGRGFLELANARTEDLPDKEDQKNRFGLATSKKSFIVFANSPQEKAKWLEVFKNVLDQIDKKLEDSKARKSIALNISNNTISRNSVNPGSVVDDDESDEEDKKNAAFWKPDSEAPDCVLCHKKFTTLFRRHHCRKCGEVVCKNCSGNKMLLKHINENKKVRVCDPCMTKTNGEVSSLGPASSSPRLSTSPSSPKTAPLNTSNDKVGKHKSLNNIKTLKESPKAGDRMTHTFGAPGTGVNGKEKDKEKDKDKEDKEKDKDTKSPSLFKKLSNKLLNNNSVNKDKDKEPKEAKTN